MKPCRILLGSLLASLCLLSGGVGAQVVTEFSAGISAGAFPSDITTGPDGNLWFTESFSGNRIGKITPSGTVTEFNAGLSAGAGPIAITAGPDGNLWFAEFNGNRIGRITPLGVISEFSAGISAGASPADITAGPDGNLWFTERNGNRIGRIIALPANGVVGTVAEFSAGITAGATPIGIAAGSDGNLWFTESSGNRIGRIDPSTGIITEFSAGITAGAIPAYITAGADGNLWFTELVGNRIGRIDPLTGIITEFSAGITANAQPFGIAAGPDGNLWFAESNIDRIGRITPLGVVTEFGVGITAGATPAGITAGPDGNLWFAEQGGDRIGRITTGVVTAQRTFVASNGNDSNPCSLAAPCRSFGAAIIKTSIGGEVVALDSAGYGPVVITKAVSIIAPPGVYAGVSVFSGTGITVNPVLGNVTLRGLTINSLGGTTGIDYQSGDALYVDNIAVSGFPTAGLNVLKAVTGTVQIQDSIFRGNGIGATFGTVGGTTATLKVVVSDSNFDGNTTGVRFTGSSAQGEIRGTTLAGSTTGALIQPTMAGAISRVDFIESTITKNSGQGMLVGGGTGVANVSATSSLISGNGFGIQASNGASVFLTDSTITRNTTGITAAGGGAIASGTLNRLYNNTTNGSFGSTVPRQ